ncbi:WXG100 family type VII secretion target [Streptomyces sp. ISL-100]|uniref:WXG100 family type VII secretion target n=1 Tax=Streptomyces sp. ISL-100 TaxID=2819173 RepID=UPI001BE7CC81|nr:WXG100 family type VII secretion target [Streptomyces sp. ISL-100]MBT2395192.1 WXG100 family type VII secretion target [Streptomyces sp. ISL-100]
MSGKETGAEELVELGIELVNPGGRPDELRQAAKAWRQLKSEVSGAEGLLKALNANVEDTVGDTWRGPAAEAFKKHWREFKAAVEEATEQYDDIAKQLDEVADEIETVNDEIHAIYIEIGVSIGVGVALSFVTLGVGAGAAAANVTRLAAQAIRISQRLGALLQRIATAIRAYQRAGKLTKLGGSFVINWVGNTGGTVLGSVASGGDVDLKEAVWQGGLAAAIGTPVGAGAASKAASKLDDIGASAFQKNMGENIAAGVAGNVAGGVGVDAHTALTTDEDPDWLKNGLVNAGGGLLGGATVGGIGHHRQDMIDRPANPNFNYPFARPSADTPSMGAEGPAGAVGAGIAGVGGEVLGPDEQESPKKETEPQSPFARQQRSIREDFG